MPEAKFIFIVELVIVIAVIAILAAVMIPTFSGVVTNAQESAAVQEVKAAYTETLADELEDGVIASTEIISNMTGDIVVEAGNGKLVTLTKEGKATAGGTSATYKVQAGKIVAK